MDLILWRHAEAEDGPEDLARALTPRGRRQAMRMAQWLKRHLPTPWTVFASPARRTQETAESLQIPFQTQESCAPGASASALLGVSGWPEHRGTLVLVGHQPTLGRLAALILTGHEAPWSVRKGAIVWLAARDREGLAAVQLRASISPDLLTES